MRDLKRRWRHTLLQRLGIELKRLHEGLVPRDVIERDSLLKDYSVGLAKVMVYEYEGRLLHCGRTGALEA